jgi:hypothetical protein
MKFFNWAKKQFLHLFPAFLFFFISFNVINLTIGLMIRKDGFSPFGFLTVFLASAVVAKVLLIVDNMSFLNIFPKKPLIYNVAWKTCLYSLVSLLIRLIDRYFRFRGENTGWQEGFENFITNVNWPLFWSVQIWYLLLFGIFVIFREFVYEFGAKKIRKLFFG